jgi:hypothetical protein
MQSELFILLSTSVVLLIIYSVSYCFIELIVKIKKICDEMKDRMDTFYKLYQGKNEICANNIPFQLSNSDGKKINLEKYIRSLELRIIKLEKNKTN